MADDIYDIYDWPIKGTPVEFVLGDEESSFGYEDERWKTDTAIPNVYVSDGGRFYNAKTNRFISSTHGDGHGHEAVKVSMNGKHYQQYTHRLLAEAFVPNPNDYPIVRHLDDDPHNNDLENLAWGTMKMNHDDCVKNGHCYIPSDEDREKAYEVMRTGVIATSPDGKEIIFDSQGGAERALGIPQSNIWKVLQEERKMAGGYKFRYANR